MIFSCLTVTGFAADGAEVPAATEETVIPEVTTDEEFEKVNAVVTELVTYIYNYATKPEEPSVDLETVLKMVTVVVRIVYTLYKDCQESQQLQTAVAA